MPPHFSRRTVRLWDMRKPNSSIHTFEGHTDEVVNVDWSPFGESVFASSAADRRLYVWDCSRIGMEQSEEDAEDGAPELVVRSIARRLSGLHIRIACSLSLALATLLPPS
jgi:WD40 repeat protein